MDYSIKELPEEERPREKLQKNGVSSLTQVELLSIILRSGTRGKNVKELSTQILDSYSLASIAERPLSELKKFEGVSNVKAGQLKALSQLARDMKREKKKEISSLQGAKKAVNDMKFLETEKLRILILSSGNKVIGQKDYEGNISEVNFNFRDIFEPVINKNGAAVILAHNHPSGSPEPTEEDLEATREIVKAGRTLEIDVLDHIIVGDQVKSMRRETDIFSGKT